jgi:UPF0271 protein
MKTIDLNCDLGEGTGPDAALMPLITSANIACGEHAGDDSTMRATVALARRHGVAIGAHPGFADRANFGRREPAEAAELVLRQIRRLQVIAAQTGAVVRHVKLHGALYNQVSHDRRLAEAVVAAIRTAGKHPVIYALAGSELERMARQSADILVVPEVFADRTYQRDGTLTPRGRPDALIADAAIAVAQVQRMISTGVVRATDGTEVPIRAGTVCLHGDGPHALAFARRLREELQSVGITLAAPGP